MSAYYRRRGEDRVTEVFASVLDQSPDLLSGLLERLSLPAVDSHEVQTQVRSAGVTIDLEVIGRGADGTARWVLWSEHKVSDSLTARQLRNEWSALKARAGSAHQRLIAITLFAPTEDAAAFAAATDCTLLRWGEITRLAHRARDHHRSQTPGVRGSTTTTVADHLLAEWIAFANNELEASVEALTPERVRLLSEADKALDTLDSLMTSGFTRACTRLGAGKPKASNDELHATAPHGSWLADRGFKLYAKYLPDGGFGDVADPCLVVGAWLSGDDAGSARRSREFHTTLSERGLAIWDEDDRHGGWIEFGEAVSLVDLAAHETFDQQDAAFGEACVRVLQTLAAPL